MNEYKSLFETATGQVVLQNLQDLFYAPILKQPTVEDTYFRLGQHDVLCYILAQINKETI